MKTRELKVLASEFSDFLGDNCEHLEIKISEFWASKFNCNNNIRQAELLQYWLTH